MKYLWRLVFLSLGLYSVPAAACDICACGSINMGMGDWMNPGRSLLNSSYQLRSFSGPLSRDYFHQFQVSGIWALNSNWQFKAALPYIFAEREASESNEFLQLNSIGDASLAVQRLLWSKMDSNSMHSVYLSGGLQLPTGKFENRPIESVFAPNFQSGSGSWDFSLNLQYQFNWREYLLVYQSSHLQNTTNRYDYRFGDQWLNSLKVARSQKLNSKLGSMLYLSLDHEFLARDVNDRGFYQFGTGGAAWFGGLGISLSTDDWNLSSLYQFRFGAASGAYQSNNQWSIQLSYFL